MEFAIVEPPVKLFKCYEIFLVEIVLHGFCIHAPFEISERDHDFICGVREPCISVFVMVTNDLLSLLPTLFADRLIPYYDVYLLS